MSALFVHTVFTHSILCSMVTSGKGRRHDWRFEFGNDGLGRFFKAVFSVHCIWLAGGITRPTLSSLLGRNNKDEFRVFMDGNMHCRWGRRSCENWAHANNTSSCGYPPKLKYHAEGGTIKEFRRLRSWTWFLMNAHDI